MDVPQPGKYGAGRTGPSKYCKPAKHLQIAGNTGRARTGRNVPLGFCTAEGVGSSPIGSIRKYADLQVKFGKR